MKILILSITFLFLVLFPSMAQEPRLSDELVFEERVFDFGEIKEEDGLVSHEFEFRNVSQKVLSINGVTSGCGCVQLNYLKNRSAPMPQGK